MKCQEFDVGARRGRFEVGQNPPLSISTRFETLSVTCPLDEDTTHRFGGGGKEMPSAVPFLNLGIVHEAQIRLMDQRRCLKRLARRFVSHLLSRQPAQLIVNQRHQLLGCARIALLNRTQDARDVTHFG
jgi:hypothetical protein